MISLTYGDTPNRIYIWTFVAEEPVIVHVLNQNMSQWQLLLFMLFHVGIVESNIDLECVYSKISIYSRTLEYCYSGKKPCSLN